MLPGGKCHPGRQSSHPALPEEQDSAQHHRGLRCPKVITSTLQASKGNSRWGSLLRLCSCFQEPGHSHGAPGAAAAPRCLPQHKALVLYTRHWTNSSTKEIKSFLHNHKAAEELTPAFSFSSVYISVKYIIYSSIGLIVIYYSLELLLSFPYFNHIYTSNFAYKSYCLKFIIKIHKIKLK